MPLQSPDHPTNTKPGSGIAVKVTVLFWGYVPLQVLVSQVKFGALTLPLVGLVIVTGNNTGAKFALQLFALLTSIVNGFAVPLQSPLQPVNIKPGSGVAVKVVVVGAGKVLVQLVPQSMPSPVTLPCVGFAIIIIGLSAGAKMGVQFFAAFNVKVNGFVVPAQSPDHPVNTKPGSGVAVIVTGEF